jgi:IclR family pca regulon transcriptional regulator
MRQIAVLLARVPRVYASSCQGLRVRGSHSFVLMMVATRPAAKSPKASGVGSRGSLAKGLRLLSAFDDAAPELTISQIARMTDLNRTTVYRLVGALERAGYLEEVRNRVYRPGLRCLLLGSAALESLELPELAAPFLERIRDGLSATVSLAALHAANVIYLARFRGPYRADLRLYVGSILPAYRTASGRAILAYSPPRTLLQILRQIDWTPATPYTVREPRELLRILRTVRREGYAINDQEEALGWRSIAAPVHDPYGVVASVTVTHPVARGSLEDITRITLPVLLQNTFEISRRLRALRTRGAE